MQRRLYFVLRRKALPIKDCSARSNFHFKRDAATGIYSASPLFVVFVYKKFILSV